MLTSEWSINRALEVEREEGWAGGWEGGAKAERDEILALVDQGYSTDEIRRMRSEKPSTVGH